MTRLTGPGDLAARGVLMSNANPCAAGRSYSGACYGDQPSRDLSFQTSVTAVPEPQTVALTLLGLGLVGCAKRRHCGRGC